MKAIVNVLFLLLSIKAKAIIFEQDDRVEVDPNSSPYNKIAKIFFNDAVDYCTGSLVGKSLILTNRHCIGFDDEGNTTAMIVAFGYTRGDYSVKANVVGVTYEELQPFENPAPGDWAILKIDKPLGKRFGHFGVMAPTDLGQMKHLLLPGFNSDVDRGMILSADEDCEVMKLKREWWLGDYNDIMVHNCDMYKGSSGGPLLKCQDLDSCSIVGVNNRFFPAGVYQTGPYRNSKAPQNMAVYSRRFMPTLRKLLAEEK